MALTIHPELQSLIPPLSPEEYDQLEQNILTDGCRDALIVWQEAGILLDGHHRWQICERHGLTYTIQELSLPDMDAAKAWLISHQLGRRNLSPNQMAYYRGQQYNLQKHRHGGDRKSEESSTQNEDLKTADRLAAAHGVSRATIERNGLYAGQVETLAAVVGPAARQVRDLPLTRPEVALLTARVVTSPETATQVKAALEGDHAAEEVRAILTVGSAPVLVLEPEVPEAEETPAPTLTERQRARSGPRDEKVPGSVAWCWQTLDLLKIQWQRKDFDDQQFEETLQEVRQHEVWKVVPPERPYGSFEVLMDAETGRTFTGCLVALQQQVERMSAYLADLPGTEAIDCKADACLALVHAADILRTRLMQYDSVRALSSPRGDRAPAPPQPAPEDPACPPFDTAIYTLGTLCPEQHEYGQTGQTLRRTTDRHCLVCDAAKARQQRQKRKDQKPAVGAGA
jgi:ParB-like chromosome segregation protein Spo0J